MKINELFKALTLLLVVLMFGCKEDDYKATVGVCPLVISTIPANGAVGVPLNQVVSATFNEVMNPATITSSTFTVVDASKSAELKMAVVVSGTLTYSGMTSFFTPSSPLSPNTTYTGRMTTAAKDLMGNALQTDYVWTFATDMPPTATSDPVNNATGVPLNKVIVVTFSAPMDSLTLKSPATNFTVKQGTTTVPGKFSYTSRTAIFTPTGNLAPFTVYTGTVSANVQNTLGTKMAADYVFNFTTIPQLSLSANPALGGTTTGTGVFAQGSSVTAVATANPGYVFFNWTDGATVASTNASYQFTMAGNKTLVANFTANYLVTVLSNPLLGGTTSGGGTFNAGTSVTVTALPNAGFTFKNWTEGVNIVSTAASYQFNIAANRSLVANYTAIPYTVAVTSKPLLGGTTTGGGVFNSGTSVSVSAVPNTGFTFTNWTEGVNIVSTDANYQFTIASNRTLVANYTASPFSIAVSSNPLLGGITTGGGTYNSGSSVTVTAVANVGFTFSNWTEGVNIVSTNASYQFTIDGNRSLVANYNAVPYTVAVSSKPLLGGTTTGGGIFNGGTLVTVLATANVGFAFTNWTEGLVIVSTQSDYQFTITGNRILVANYEPVTYGVAVSSNPLIGGITTGGGTFNAGASVTVHAVANSGYTFTNWTEGLVVASTNANYLFTLSGNRILVANYTPVSNFNVAVSSNPLAGGTSTGGGTFASGASVTIAAVPNSGYTFTNWTEGVTIVSTLGNHTFVITGNRTFVANYAPIIVSCPTVVNLGLAGNYVILSQAGISTTGTTHVTGNMGVSPITSTAITGDWALNLPAGGTFSTSPRVTGNVYASDYNAPTPGLLTTAINNMTTAFTTANGMAPTVPAELLAGNLNSQTLVAGVYKWGTGVTITTGLTLDGGGDDCATFIFQIAGDFTVANSAIITLQNGAKAKNIFWVVAGSKAALGTGVNFSGNILCKTLISLNTGASVTGKLLSQTAVTLDASTVVEP